jgi:ABC-type lipoprotein release transport system permease subunit
MIFQIAWRNIWRNRTRSLVVIGSVLIGVWSILFIVSFSAAMVSGYVKKAIQNETSHFQIHPKDFLEDKDIKYFLANPNQIKTSVLEQPMVKAVSVRSIVNGMLRSSRGARGLTIRGIDSSDELLVTEMDKKLVEGKFFTEGRKNEIIISQVLADKLKLKLRKKVVLQFQDLNKDITAGAFRIVGIYKTGNTLFDERMAMVRRSDLNRLIGREDIAHEVAILLEKKEALAAVGNQLKTSFPDLSVQSYREISPEVQLYESQIDVSATIFTVIFMLALIFGIINTMLMAVLERNRELGMLMAVGMNKSKVFSMIVLETLFLGLIAAPIGLVLGWLSINYFGKKGIDLSAFSQSIEQFGLSTQIYTELAPKYYISLAFSVLITALLAALYPAWKAIRLKPVEAIRKI